MVVIMVNMSFDINIIYIYIYTTTYIINLISFINMLYNMKYIRYNVVMSYELPCYII